MATLYQSLTGKDGGNGGYYHSLRRYAIRKQLRRRRATILVLDLLRLVCRASTLKVRTSHLSHELYLTLTDIAEHIPEPGFNPLVR
jgi:hypothetical protein